MKIFKIICVSLFVLILILIFGLVIFIKTFDVNRLKPQIISRASKALGRQVNFDKAKLDISFRRGINLNVNNLVIADDPAFAKGDFFRVKNISLAVDVLGYVFQKKIQVPNVLIDSPRVNVIRQRDGGINAQSMGRPGKVTPAAAPLAIPAFFVSYLKVTGGTVNFIDHSLDPPMSLEIADLNFFLNKISLTEAFPFVIEAAVLSAKRNIRIDGKVQIDLKNTEVSLSQVKGTFDLSGLSQEKIVNSFPMVKGIILPQNLKGKIEVQAPKFTAGPKGLAALAFDAKASIGIGQGVINASGALDDLVGWNYNVAANIRNLKIEDVLAQYKPALKAEGFIAGKIKVKGKGLDPQAITSNLSGDADISITRAKLKDINVLRLVLDKISLLPGLAQRLEEGLPEKYRQKLSQKDTVLSDIKLPILIEKGRLIIKDAVFGAEGFMFKGKGEAHFDGTYSLEGSFLVPQDLSAAIVAEVPEMQYLLDDYKQIYIPLKVSGKAGKPEFNLDANYIAKRLLAQQAQKQISNLLDKILGEGEGTTQEGEAAPQGEPDDKTRIKETIGSLLGDIFR